MKRNESTAASGAWLRLPDGEYLTIPEAARLAKVSKRTVYNWINRGTLQAARNAGGSLRVLARTVINIEELPLQPTSSLREAVARVELLSDQGVDLFLELLTCRKTQPDQWAELLRVAGKRGAA